MPFLALIPHYFFWHYFLAWRDMVLVFRNLFWFLINFFSLPVLLRTLFSPWRRLSEAYPRGLDLTGVAETMVVNTLMRLVGFLVRSVMIFFALLVLFFALFGALLFFIIWPFLPLLFALMLAAGFYLLLT